MLYPIDVSLIAPVLLDPKGGIVDLVAGGSALFFPVLLGLYSINLILVRLADLRLNLPYAQGGAVLSGALFLEFTVAVDRLGEGRDAVFDVLVGDQETKLIWLLIIRPSLSAAYLTPLTYPRPTTHHPHQGSKHTPHKLCRPK